MSLSNLKNQAAGKRTPNIFALFLIILFTAALLAHIVTPAIAGSKPVLHHTILELACIFIALSMFLVVWLAYERNSPVNHIIALGFLTAAVFNIFHTYYYLGISFDPNESHLTVKFWVIGRFTEALVLLLSTLKMYHLRVNKWVGLWFSISFALSVSWFIKYFPGLLPVLFAKQGVTLAKTAAEFIIITIFLAGLFYLKKEGPARDMQTYRYVFLALLISVPTELCYTFGLVKLPFYNYLGHFLKITYFYCLFRGVFVSAVTYPYEKLEEAGKYTANILNELPVGLITFDSHSKLSFANLKSQELLGYQLDEIYGLTIDEFTELINLKEPSLIRQISRNPIIDKVRTIRNKHGNYVKLKIDVHILESGGLLYLFDEAKKKQELANLQLQTQTILNSINNFVLIMDTNRKIIACNKTFEDIVELEAKDILGRNLKDFNEMMNFSKKELPMKLLKQETLDELQEASFVTPRGTRKEIIVHTGIIHNVEGEVLGAIGVGSDVTVLKQQEQKLQQQEKLAVLGQMAAGICHEIKNPLTAIKGFSQVIVSHAQDEKTKHYASIIEGEAINVNKVVSDFLAFARPHPPILKEVSLNEMVQSMKLMLETHSFMEGVDIILSLGSEEKTVMTDRDQMQQVVLNITKNAIEALSECENPQLTISTGLNDITGEMYIIIADNGVGMSEDDKIKAGTPFFTTKDYGTGLGLSICFQIIKEHGGRIEIDSKLGQGTAFTISLPCAACAAALQEETPHKFPPPIFPGNRQPRTNLEIPFGREALR